MSLNLEVTDMAGATVEHSTVNYHLAQPAVWRAAWPSMLWKSETFTVITNFVAMVHKQLKDSTCRVFPDNVQYRWMMAAKRR